MKHNLRKEFFVNSNIKRPINKIIYILIILLLSYIVTLSPSQSSLYDKNYIQGVNEGSHICSFDLSHSKFYLIQNDRGKNVHSNLFFNNTSIFWILIGTSLILFIRQKRYANHNNKNPGLKKRLKNILKPRNYGSKFKACSAVNWT